MYSFFEDIGLKDKGDKNWPELLDWIFLPHFEGHGWNKESVTRFTKNVKRELSLGRNNYSYSSAKSLPFPKNKSKARILI